MSGTVGGHVPLQHGRERHLSVDERRQVGLAAAELVPPGVHGDWEPDASRPDPVALLEEQNTTRDPDLVPVRHGRMSASAFTFFRGGARIMAEDLARMPSSGLVVQLCGDAHLSNFGVYASPERRLVFDLNDFDETLPGPFEQDLVRLAASFAVAATDNGFDGSDRADVTRCAVRAYQDAMSTFATMRTMDVWYAHLPEGELREMLRDLRRSAKDARDTKAFQRGKKNLVKARERDHLHALRKLTEVVDGEYRIATRPPLVVAARDLAAAYGTSAADIQNVVRQQYDAYLASLQDDRRALLERFKVVDVARKVVGVGSVGTRAFIVLLEGRDRQDPLFLQAKEASRSVLEHHLPVSRFDHPGERVVRGQRLMQATSDILLGWSEGSSTDHQYYFRQLRDMKASADVGGMSPVVMQAYAQLCGWTLARAHARSGDAIAIDAYLASDPLAVRAVTEVGLRYAAQNQRDYEQFTEAIESGRLEVRRDL